MKATTYDELTRALRGFADGHLNLLVIHGRPGKCKTEIARAILPEAQYVRGGNVSEFKLYCELYEHMDEDFIFDDLDHIYRQRGMIRLLKALCDTRPAKEIRWVTAAGGLKNDGIPTRFETRSRLVLICNDWKSLNQNIDALENRGDVIEFAPSTEALHAHVGGWFHDPEIYEYIGRHLRLAGERLSARDYVLSVGRRSAGLDWRKSLLDRWQIDPDDGLVLRLVEDVGLSMAERVRRFKTEAVGGRSERRFYYIYERLRSWGAARKPLQFCSEPVATPAKLQANQDVSQTEAGGTEVAT